MLQYQRRLIRLAIFVLATPALLFAQDAQHEGRAEAHELAITGATLIDGTGGAPRPATTIIVRDGRIAAVTPDADAEVPAGAREIDAAGKYVIPGLADMHVHLSLGLPLPRQENETDVVLARELYYGVTTILAIGASDASPESIHSHRARRAAGELRAPYIYGTEWRDSFPAGLSVTFWSGTSFTRTSFRRTGNAPGAASRLSESPRWSSHDDPSDRCQVGQRLRRMGQV